MVRESSECSRIPLVWHPWDGQVLDYQVVDSSWNVMAHGDTQEGKWRGNWRMEWVAGTLHTTSEHGVPSINTADARTSAAGGQLNWCPRWLVHFAERRNLFSAFVPSHFKCSLPTLAWVLTCNVLWMLLYGGHITKQRGILFLPIISSLWGVNVTFFPLPPVPFLLILGSFEAIINSWVDSVRSR